MRSNIKQLVLASSNAGKLKELSAIFADVDIEVLPQSQFDIVDVEETGTTFVENAILKAKHASKISGLPALGDDSGLVVPALGGAPGIYSARYAQETPDAPKSDAKNNEKLLAELAGIDDRRAAFVCVMALCLSDTHPLPLLAEGIWQGEIETAPHGDGGFGYDPLFFVPSHGMTAAEMNKAEKNRVSHRGQALQSLLAELKGLR
ncbi:MAG: non-canonical purine NTP pyrophosphatase, RdgB/HAM1 family [Gammaproteobacteria bacterium]|nr:MAG: non-canonical purine NTP pyrophosphatase, RdgB/HAM1 family [Gammaproteobacteria bacterium]